MSIEDLTSTAIRKICPACSREYPGSQDSCLHDGNVLTMLPSDPYIKRRLADKYFVEKLIGSGGMGTVYLAKHEAMKRWVAIKMMRAQFIQDDISKKRFNHEAVALGKLEHPNIISVYDHGETAHGQPYIVMELLQGMSLAQLIKEFKGLPVGRVIDIFEQVCEALDFAHKKGVLHRDLKPGNIMLLTKDDKPDYVKVVDFGVAKLMEVAGEEAQTLTQQGEVCGSPVYMSPEQCLGRDLDRRADIYSMGIVLFESLTGKLPLLGKNMMETMGKHIHEAPPGFQQVRPDLYIPERLEQVVMKALAKKPEERQQSMAQLKAELLAADPRPRQEKARPPGEHVSQNLNLRAKISSVPLPDAQPEKTLPMVPIVAGLVALLLTVGGICIYFAMRPAPAPVHSTVPADPSPAGTRQTLPGNAAVPVNPGSVPAGNPASGADVALTNPVPQSAPEPVHATGSSSASAPTAPVTNPISRSTVTLQPSPVVRKPPELVPVAHQAKSERRKNTAVSRPTPSAPPDVDQKFQSFTRMHSRNRSNPQPTGN